MKLNYSLVNLPNKNQNKRNNMTKICCIPNCQSNYSQGKTKFYLMPKISKCARTIRFNFNNGFQNNLSRILFFTKIIFHENYFSRKLFFTNIVFNE